MSALHVTSVVQGGLPGFEAVHWYGLVAPDRTPESIIGRRNHEINALLAIEDFRDTLNKAGAEAMPGSPGAVAPLIASEIPLWCALIRAASKSAGG